MIKLDTISPFSFSQFGSFVTNITVFFAFFSNNVYNVITTSNNTYI